MNFRTPEPDPIVTIHCDGSCLDNGNSGPGGWAALLEFEGKTKIIKGCAESTTNNRMELKSCIEGLRALKKPCSVHVYSDSQYLVKTMTEGWKKKANQDLWTELDLAMKGHKVKFFWVPGHSGNARNEIVNGLAQEEAKKLKGGMNDDVRRESDGVEGTEAESSGMP